MEYEIAKRIDNIEAIVTENYKMIKAIYDELQIEKKEVDKKKK